jgi:hypothetical protein
MAGPSTSARLQTLYDAALQEYESKTGVTLAQHPLTMELERCRSVDDIVALLQGRAQAFSEIDRMMKAIKATVSILTPLSDAPSLAGAVGLVCQKVLMASSTSLSFLQTSSPPVRTILVAFGILLDVCAVIELIFRYCCDIQVNQATNGIVTSGPVLPVVADLLESIESFVRRLSIYTQISPTPAIDKILVKIIVELISILALVNRTLIRGRSREYFLTDS